jgi:hypothetical protein
LKIGREFLYWGAQPIGMGIRYYAYPITADEYAVAVEDPCAFHGSDPLMDAWGPAELKPEMLYLDKCWSYLQVLLGSGSGESDRPALQLVDGKVTDTGTGWIPYEHALSPEQVKAVMSDLETVGESDIRRMLADNPRSDGRAESDFEYVAQYLEAAKRFTAQLARSNRGLVYMIG